MPGHPATVALVSADGTAADALAPTAALLDEFGVAWRQVAPAAWSDNAGWRAVIVASPDAALPGALAAATRQPVIRVPSGGGDRPNSELLQAPDGNLPAAAGEDAFATMAIGEAGAKNAALFVISVLALTDGRLRAAWAAYRARQTAAVLAHPPLT